MRVPHYEFSNSVRVGEGGEIMFLCVYSVNLNLHKYNTTRQILNFFNEHEFCQIFLNVTIHIERGQWYEKWILIFWSILGGQRVLFHPVKLKIWKKKKKNGSYYTRVKFTENYKNCEYAPKYNRNTMGK